MRLLRTKFPRHLHRVFGFKLAGYHQKIVQSATEILFHAKKPHSATVFPFFRNESIDGIY